MKILLYLTLFLSIPFLFDHCKNNPSGSSEPVQTGLQCDSPDAPLACHFVGRPTSLSSELQITEPVNLVIKGQIKDAKTQQGIPNVIMYVYHTDEKGLYTRKGQEKGVQRWHGHLHGWCQTDEEGRYEIRTLRPAPYPSGGIPAHIHPVFRLDNNDMFFGNDFVFADDPLVNSRYLRNLNNPRNPKHLDNGVLELSTKEGIAYGHRDIFLLQN